MGILWQVLTVIEIFFGFYAPAHNSYLTPEKKIKKNQVRMAKQMPDNEATPSKPSTPRGVLFSFRCRLVFVRASVF